MSDINIIPKCQWADLPGELLEIIGKCLDSRVDVLRFRAVCTSWRSRVPLPSFDQEMPRLILKLPQTSFDAVLFQTTICRMELLLQNPSSSSSSSSSSSELTKGWLTKVGESTHGKLELLHPISNQQVRYSPIGLNLLDVGFVQFGKAFTLKTPGGYSVWGINKVVLFPISASCSDRNECAILAIYHEGKLGYWKYGDEKWTVLDDKNFQYDDIIIYKGQYYVVDRWGTVSWIDSSLKVIQYSPPLYGCGARKNLVESCGDLYVVDRYLHGERRTWYVDDDNDANVDDHFHQIVWFENAGKSNPKAVDFRVYKLDEEWGTWVDVKSLGDRVFVLGIDCCFSVSAREFVGGKGNCIYYTDDEFFVGRGLTGDGIHVFHLEDHSIENLVLTEYNEIFWPPPPHHILCLPGMVSVPTSSGKERIFALRRAVK